MKLSNKTVSAMILGIVVVIVLFQVFASLVPQAQTSSDTLGDSARCEVASCSWNASTTACQVSAGNITACTTDYNPVPLSGLFASTGVIFYIIMASLLLLVIGSYLKGKK